MMNFDFFLSTSESAKVRLLSYQIDRFVWEPFSDEGDNWSTLTISSSLVNAVSLLEAAKIFRLEKS